jgi:uncharacterized protein (DUF58 family)
MTEGRTGRLSLERLLHRRLDWKISRHARRLSLLALAGLALAVVMKRPEFVAVAAPALVLLGTWRGAKPEVVQVGTRLSATRVFEGEQVAVEVFVAGLGDSPLELVLHPADGIKVVSGYDRAATSPASLSLAVTRWGRYWPGYVEVVAWDRCRLFEAHCFVPLPELDCYPLPAVHRKAVVLGPLASRAGDHPARTPGEGMEFAGVRQYVPGDRQRSINWAATTRRGRLQVNTFAAERSEDVVVVVDATSDVGELGSTTVDHALRGALGVARTYLDARDRVGMVFFGERMRWLAPGMGDRQFFRLLDAVLAGRAGWSSGNDITRLPRVALPPGAAVIAFSPLLEPRFVETLRDLRQRGFSVIVVDVLDVTPRPTRDRLDRLAERIWRLERQALMFSIRELGITVVPWDGRGELAVPGQRRTRQPVGARR